MSGDPQLSAHYLSVGLQNVAKKHCIHLGMGLLTMGFTVGWSGWPVSLGNTQGSYLLVFSQTGQVSPEKSHLASWWVLVWLPEFWDPSRERTLEWKLVSVFTVYTCTYSFCLLPPCLQLFWVEEGQLVAYLHRESHSS